MTMDKTKAASKASDEHLRAALEVGDTDSVQLGTGIDINKQRNQVARLGFGKGGNAG
jgi:hypothetical protein